ncbi:hypothetical protein ACFL47_09265 [Candidatus Latescibacterota bacterium]
MGVDPQFNNDIMIQKITEGSFTYNPAMITQIMTQLDQAFLPGLIK